jgi:hypothetical protein
LIIIFQKGGTVVLIKLELSFDLLKLDENIFFKFKPKEKTERIKGVA